VLFSLEGKTAVVTGGSRGIGKMIAAGFVGAGVKVYIAARKHAASLETAKELSANGGECIAFEADLSSEAGCRGLAEQIAGREATIDILVNNAGATWATPIEDFGEAEWERALSVNLKGVFYMTRFLLPQLRAAASIEDPARVINIGSFDGLRPPIQDTFSYAASKAGVHMLTRHLATKLAPTITVNAIAPGPFESKMMAETLRQFGDTIVRTTPMKRIGRPDDLAGTAIFLASRAGSYLTGAIIPVDGGLSAL
jgi:NAD(P)-dependent dehydrogenase (short-subunit alcohol dehydrogenase family)